MKGRQVCITGIGAITAAGQGVDALRTMLLTGSTRVRPDPELGGLPVGRAPEPMKCKGARRLDRSGAARQPPPRPLNADRPFPEHCAVPRPTEGS